MSKLTNRDIERIIKQRLKGKPVAEIARYFQVTRQQIYQIIKAFNEIQDLYSSNPEENHSSSTKTLKN